MSFYSADPRCPRCQYANPPGAATCANCGLVLTSTPQTPYGSDPLAPPPPPVPPATGGNPFGPPPGSGAYGSGTNSYNNAPNYDFSAPPPPPPPTFAGSPSYYTGSQQQGFTGTAPAYAGSQPPLFPPPGLGQPPMQQARRGPRVGLIVLVVVVLVALIGGGVAAYLLSRPKPTITIASKYLAGTTPAGAASTVVQVNGQHFSGSSTITFLLDGQIAPGSQTALSDGSGNVTATLTVTADWPVGQHTLTARDSSGNTTPTGATFVVVTQGADGTPGPNGSPSDNSSFNLSLTVQPKDAVTGDSLNTFNMTLAVQSSSPQVCDLQYDDGQPHSFSGTDNIGNYQETFVWKCTGSYQNGKLVYTETTTSDKLTYTSGISCTGQTPYVYVQLNGSFSSATRISGTYSSDTIQYTCNKGGNLHTDAQTGTWSGSTA